MRLVSGGSNLRSSRIGLRRKLNLPRHGRLRASCSGMVCSSPRRILASEPLGKINIFEFVKRAPKMRLTNRRKSWCVRYAWLTFRETFFNGYGESDGQHKDPRYTSIAES